MKTDEHPNTLSNFNGCGFVLTGSFGKLLGSDFSSYFLFGLFGGEEMLGFLRTRQELQMLFGISFISLPSFRPLAP